MRTKTFDGGARLDRRRTAHAIHNNERLLADITQLIQSSNESSNANRVGIADCNDSVGSYQNLPRGPIPLWGIVDPVVFLNCLPNVDYYDVIQSDQRIDYGD